MSLSNKKSKAIKRWLAMLLSLVMVLSNLSLGQVYAEETGGSTADKTYILNASDLTAETLTASKTAGTDSYFTIKAMSSNSVIIDANNKSFTVDGTKLSITNRIKLGGPGNADARNISFTVKEGTKADITVCVCSSSSSADAKLQLYSGTSAVPGTDCFVERGKTTVVSWTDIPAGDYYMTGYKTDATAETAAIEGNPNIYYVAVTEKSAGGEGGGSGAGDTELVDFSNTYDFRDGSIVPTTTDGKGTVTSANKKLTVAPGNKNAYAYNGAQHGVQFKEGNTITIKVKKGTGTVQVGDCQYSKTDVINVSLGGESIGTLSPATTGCYDQDTTNNVLKIDYTCASEEADLVLTFNNTVYVPVIIVSGKEPKPAVTEVTANITVNSNNLLGEGDKITLVSDKEGAEPIDITAANATDYTLAVNSTYKIVSSNPDTKATADGSDSVVTTTENLTVTVNVEPTVVNPTVTFTDAAGVLGDAVLTLTNNADETDAHTLSNGGTVKLKIGASYKLTCSSAAITAKINDSILITAAKDLTAITVVIEAADTTRHTYDVWDFGAEQLAGTDKVTYNNKLTEDIINGWFTGTAAGTSGIAIPADFIAYDAEGNEEFRFNAGGKTNNRLRTTNTNLTRYDSKSLKNIEDSSIVYTGYLYSNSSKTESVNVQLAVKAGDIVTFVVSSNGTASNLTWKSPSGVEDVKTYSGTSSQAQEMTFYAAEDGMYTLYSATEKLVVARIYRERPNKATVSGSVTVPDGADLSNGKLVFTNTTTGTKTEAAITEGAYSVQLSEQYGYNVSLIGANGYIVDENNSLALANEAGNTSYNVNIIRVDMVTISGSLADLTADAAGKLVLTFKSDKVFVPEYTIDAANSTYTAKVEKGVTYQVEASGVNDYTLETTSVVADADGTIDLKFNKKPTYAVNVTMEGLSAEEAANVKLTFANIKEEGYVYTYTGTQNIALRDGQYKVTAELEGYTQKLTADVKINGAAADKTIGMKSNSQTAEPVAYKEVITVGANGDYKTINDALEAVRNMNRTADQRVTISIAPGNYEEMLVIDVDNVTLKNAAANPSIELTNKGVDIAEGAVRITSYYGHGYTYYSMGPDCKYDAELLAVNKENGYPSFENPGSGTTAGSYWNATVVVNADGFVAEGIIFENSFNQYVSAKAAEDVIVKQSSAKEGSTPRAGMQAGDVTVQNKAYVERAAALAIYNNKSDIVFNNCKFVGRQDTLYGGTGVYAEFNECSVYGGTDYIFGGMTAIFNKCDLVFNTSEDKNDVGYITAAQQKEGRGYLMYQCHITSTTPGVDTASAYTSKPGYLGRPWQANTSEVVFYETKIDAADANWEGGSLISAAGWLSTLSGESAGMYEYGTVEASGVDNSASRAAWCTMLTGTTLNDGTEISFEAFRKPAVIEGYYVIDIKNGLKKGVTYDGGISVIEDMAYKAVDTGDTISGTKYYGYVAGSNNPKTDGANAVGSVPDTGSVLKLTAEKDGKLKLAVKINAGKTVYFVDEQDASDVDKHENSTASSEFILLSYEVEAGHTYYFYGNGTKVPMYNIVVDYREPESWDNIAAPVLGTPVADNKNGTITVPFTALVGGIYADSLEVRMLNAAGEIVDTISYATESNKGSVEFEPNASGSYTFQAVLRRSGALGKTSNVTEKVDFVLPMKTPVIIGVENQGGGAVKFSWKEVSEAESYKVYLNGEYKDTVTKPYVRFEGLTVGQEYTFAVEAVHGEDVSAQGEVKQTITQEAKKTWYYAAFGSGVDKDKKNNGSSGSVESNDLSVWSLNGKGKIVPASTDGLAFYYTTIDPDTENFTLSADIEVVNWTYSNGQEGFGMMAADTVGENGDSSTFWNNSYMASVTKVEYFWDKNKQEVSDSGDKYTMKLGVGSQEKIGVTKENIANETTVNEFSSIMTTLETYCPKNNLGAGTYNIAGNYTNEGVDMGDVNLTTTFHLTIQRNNTGYFLSYTDKDGNTVTKKYYHGDDGDELTKLDENNIYIGFFASRNAKINVKNVQLTTIKPEADAPAEERPVSYVTPNYTIESAKNANSSDYDLVYYGNAAGTLTIKNDKGEVLKTSDGLYEVKNLQVDANTKIHTKATLAAGDNKFTITFTPNADYQPSKYERLSSYESKEFTFTVTYKASSLNNLYISPNGSSKGLGTKDSPMDIYTAVKYAAPGQKLLLMEGTYQLSGTVTVERGINGTKEQPIYMMADPEAKTRPVLDFGGKCAGMVLAGDYWYFKGFDVTNSANGQKGIQVSGSYNTLDNLHAYKNGNTGIQISRYKGTDEWEDWPSNNLILNCTSYLNADAGYEDADGFAAKLTIADGNVFDGCIAAYNADDGWDLFAKVESGPIGKVIIRNSIAFKNGYVIDAEGKEVNAGNGNGFKMGGSSISGYHLLENSIAFANKAKGIDSNSCPDIQVRNCTSFNNESFNVAFYTNDAKNTDFAAAGIISYKNDNAVAEQLKLKGTQDESKVYGTTNYYFNGKVSKNTSGATVVEGWFKSLDVDAAIHGGITRNADGTINTNGFLELTDAAPADAGARMSGTASGDSGAVTPDETDPEIKTVIDKVYNQIINISSESSLEDKINAVAEALAALDYTDMTNIYKIANEDIMRFTEMEGRIQSLLGTKVSVLSADGLPEIAIKNALLSIPAGRDGVINVGKKTDIPSVMGKENLKNATVMTFELTCNSDKYALKVPVVVSMKAPEGLDLNKTVVVCHLPDNSDKYDVYPVAVHEDGTISFTTGSFSTFVVANLESQENNGGNNNDGDNNGGNNNGGSTDSGNNESGNSDKDVIPGDGSDGKEDILSPGTGYDERYLLILLAGFSVLVIGGSLFYVKHGKEIKIRNIK